jgi:hypothetical protein
MSLLKISGKAGSPMLQLVNEIRTVMRENGAEFASPLHAQQVTSLESLNPAELESLNIAAQSISETLRHSFESLTDRSNGLGFEALSAAQLEAGVITAMAAGNPVDYARAALTRTAKGSDGVLVISAEASGSAGRLDYREDYSLEAFDQRQLSEMLPYSIAFNVQASRQDEFSETFYPTTVVSPDNGGIDISVDRITVFNHILHQTSGKTTDFSQRNLLESVVDAGILADESTALVPYVQENGSNASAFVSPTLVAPNFRKIATVDVKTAPLKVGEKLDLLGLSQHPVLMGAGVMDNTDAIDSRIFLKNIYLQSGGATGPVLRFNVARLPRAGFLKSIEGQNREMEVNFRSNALTLNKDTIAVDGSEPVVLQSVRDANYTVRLSLNITGNAHVEFGTVQVFSAPITLHEIEDEDGEKVSLVAGAGLAIANALADLTMIGYELGASRTNSNRRTRGLLINSYTETERFAIPLGAPISAPSPIGSDRDTRDLDCLISAARIRNSNNAVTTLLNYADTLRSYVLNRRTGHGVPVIEGIARHVIVPFYEETDLNVKDAINSLTSAEKAQDISAVLVNAIRDVVYRMYRYSGYQIALDASSNGGKKVVLLVGTDNIIQRHIMVSGDLRTFGIAFEEAKIVTSFDKRMDGKLILAFTRQSGDGVPDPLAFGTHAWIPELTSSIMVNRDGATYQEAMVQPRQRHINNLPIMAVINVTGLEDVLTTNIALNTNELTDPPVGP